MKFAKEEELLIRKIISNEIEEQINNLRITYMTGSIDDFIQDFDYLKTEVDIYKKLCNGFSEEA